MLAIPWPTKSFGVLLASYAASDGSRIHPGEEHLARITGLTERSVRSHLAALRDTYYLIERTEKGSLASRRDYADVYRLVMPDDVMTRIGLVPGEQPKRRPEPAGQQEKLPIEPVDNYPTTGNPLPVDNTDHRKPTSGGIRRPPETERTTTGNSLHDHRKLSARPPEADFRSPIQGPIQDQNNDHLSSPDLPNPRVKRQPVDSRSVDNSPHADTSAGWNAVIGQVRDKMAAAAKTNPRHARPTPEPIVRPDRE